METRLDDPNTDGGRAELERTAKELLGATVKLDSLDDTAIKREVLRRIAPTERFDHRSDHFITLAYEQRLEMHRELHGDSADSALEKAHAHADGARQHMVDAWRRG
jgi:hypothetical protein